MEIKDYNLYAIFLKAVELKNYSHAAEAVGLSSHKIISEKMRLLEDRLGVKLFVTNPRGAMPTSDAYKLCDLIIPAFAAIENAKRNITFDEGATDTLSFRCPPQIMGSLLERITEFTQKYPNMKFEIISDGPTCSTELLRDLKIDFAFSLTPLRSEDFITSTIREFTDTFFATKRFMKENNLSDKMTIHQLRKLPIIGAKRVLNREKFESLGKIQPVLDTQNFETIYDATLCNLGIGFITTDYLDKRDNTDIVKITLTDYSLPKAYLYLSYNKNYMSSSARAFLKSMNYLDEVVSQ